MNYFLKNYTVVILKTKQDTKTWSSVESQKTKAGRHLKAGLRYAISADYKQYLLGGRVFEAGVKQDFRKAVTDFSFQKTSDRTLVEKELEGHERERKKFSREKF